MRKLPGQLAMEAYYVGSPYIPSWDRIDNDMRETWQRVAAAVIGWHDRPGQEEPPCPRMDELILR